VDSVRAARASRACCAGECGRFYSLTDASDGVLYSCLRTLEKGPAAVSVCVRAARACVRALGSGECACCLSVQASVRAYVLRECACVLWVQASVRPCVLQRACVRA
jgi:hypothetical protein